MMNTVSYGIGGYLPDHPNGNITARTVDNGDGTATTITYTADGQVADEVTFPHDTPAVVDLPDPLVLLAEVGADLAAIPATATSTQMRTALRSVGQKITDAIEA